MPFERSRYTVYLKAGMPDDGEGYDVEVSWADQLLAEREGSRHGLTDMRKQALQFTTYWCWAAMKRTYGYAGDFQQFLNVDLEEIDAHQKPVEVPPTEPAPAG